MNHYASPLYKKTTTTLGLKELREILVKNELKNKETKLGINFFILTQSFCV